MKHKKCFDVGNNYDDVPAQFFSTSARAPTLEANKKLLVYVLFFCDLHEMNSFSMIICKQKIATRIELTS